MKKIVFFDMDGTIVDESNEITPSSQEALGRLRANGILTAVATGRSSYEFDDFRRNHDCSNFDLLIYGNGGIIEYHGKRLCHYHIDHEEICALLDKARSLGIDYGVAGEETWRFSNPHHPAMQVIFSGRFLSMPEMYDADFYKTHEVDAGTLFCSQAEAMQFLPLLKTIELVQGTLVGGKLGPHIDFWRKDKTKSSAVREAAALLGVDMANTYAFGDGYNDLDMIKAVGCGVAMGNGVEELKRIAKFVTKSIEEDGVRYGLEQLGLI